MDAIKKKYANDEITVLWQPDLCIHSKLCWKGLIAVFNPREKPWVNINGASTEKIIAQVSKCPSGALSYYHNEMKNTEEPIPAGTIVEVLENGPLLVHGSITLKTAGAEKEMSNKTTAFCRCGSSANKPYCDGSHTKAGFEG
jgi:uncharacterized Fe-S cluster protein YjdI